MTDLLVADFTIILSDLNIRVSQTVAIYMGKSNKHIEIVRSSTKGLSSMSKESADAIYTVLYKYFTEVGVTIINNFGDLESLVLRW